MDQNARFEAAISDLEISLRLLESGKSSAERYQSAFQAKLGQLEVLTPAYVNNLQTYKTLLLRRS